MLRFLLFTSGLRIAVLFSSALINVSDPVSFHVTPFKQSAIGNDFGTQDQLHNTSLLGLGDILHDLSSAGVLLSHLWRHEKHWKSQNNDLDPIGFCLDMGDIKRKYPTSSTTQNMMVRFEHSRSS